MKTTNEEILNNRANAYNKIQGPRVGDFLQLPYGMVTRFTHDRHEAHNGIYFKIPFRVFELLPGADTKGLPQIAKFERDQYLNGLPKITHKTGNGQNYDLPLPELLIAGLNYEPFIAEVLELTGLNFKKDFAGNYLAQPETYEQIAKLFCIRNFKTTFYNNSTHKNLLKLEINH